MFYTFHINFSPVIWILHIWRFPVSYALLQDIFTDNVNMVCPPILESIQNGLINRIVAYSFNNISGKYEMNGFNKSINFPLANPVAKSFNGNNGIGFIYGNTRKNGNNTFLISVDRTSLSDVGNFDVVITMAFDLPFGSLTFQMSTLDGLIYNRYYSRNTNSSLNNWRIYNSRYAVGNGFNFLIFGSNYVRLDDICIFQVCADSFQFDSTINKCTDKCYYKNCHSPYYCKVINDAAVCSCPLNYKLDSDGTTCLISTLCLSKKCEYICNEISGNAVCTCPTGMAMNSFNLTCQKELY
nr:uncharacterized protein LOC101240770 [Hydra vulgaris]